MRAAAIDRFGPPSVLKIHELPVPAVGARDVLIELDTAGVGSWDADIRAGWWPAGKPRFPLVLGTDGAGRIAAVGSRVRRFRVGDRAYAYVFTQSERRLLRPVRGRAGGESRAVFPGRSTRVEPGPSPSRR